MKAKSYFFLSIFSIILLLSSCDDNDDNRRKPDEKTESENEWIYKQMKGLYLWDVPSKPNFNQDPKAFFESLLYERHKINGDRFSYIVEKENSKAKSGAISQKLGFDIQTILYYKERKSGPSPSVGFFVLNVRENTDAKAKGLKRGNIIYAVNDNQINYDNYQDMEYYLETASSASLSFYDENGLEKTISDIKGNFSGDMENPIWLSKIVEDGIGYIVYNQFEKGNNNEYDIELVKTIETLVNNKGAKNLVIDLRYNPGGYLISATHLASALVPNRNTSDIFLKYNYNSARHDSLSSLHGNYINFLDHVYNTGQAIPKTNLNSLYILTSENTASASEAIISGLKPYMGDKLKQVGMTTMGKDKGSWAVEVSNFNHVLHPMIMRISNKNNNSEYGGNYENGISPASNLNVNDWEGVYEIVIAKNKYGTIYYCPLISEWKGSMKELGDKEETLLATAIADIKGEKRNTKFKSYETKIISAKVPVIERSRKPIMIVEPIISE